MKLYGKVKKLYEEVKGKNEKINLSIKPRKVTRRRIKAIVKRGDIISNKDKYSDKGNEGTEKAPAKTHKKQSNRKRHEKINHRSSATYFVDETQ